MLLYLKIRMEIGLCGSLTEWSRKPKPKPRVMNKKYHFWILYWNEPAAGEIHGEIYKCFDGCLDLLKVQKVVVFGGNIVPELERGELSIKEVLIWQILVC